MNFKMQFYYSNRVECLYQDLKENLFFHSADPFTRRFVIVPSPAMKQWLTGRMADDPDLGIAAGMQIATVDAGISMLSKGYLQNQEELPKKLSPENLSLLIEAEIRKIFEEWRNKPRERNLIWQPLITYFNGVDALHKPGRKEEKRLLALADTLAEIFQEYAEYGNRALAEWILRDDLGWQQTLWKRVVGASFPEACEWRKDNVQLHLFGVSFINALKFRMLMQFSALNPAFHYLLSPCQAFWSDLVSDREGNRIRKQWQAQKSAAAQELQLEEYLYDRNRLLANFGRLGREMARLVEESGAAPEERYVLPACIANLPHYADILPPDILLFGEPSRPATLLECVQADLALLRNPSAAEIIDCNEPFPSIQVHQACSLAREVEAAYDLILSIIKRHGADDEPILPEDVIVMAPQIADYAPYIKAVFNDRESVLKCQIMDLQILSEKPLIKGMLQLINLPFGRWDAMDVLDLFESPPFQRKCGLSNDDLLKIRQWIKEADVRWGYDREHRTRILEREHGTKAVENCSAWGTWELAFERLLYGIAMIGTEEDDLDALGFYPLSIDMTKAETLGKWRHLLSSLREDLKPLVRGEKKGLKEWSEQLLGLAEKYLHMTPSEEVSADEIDELKKWLKHCAYMNGLEGRTFDFKSLKHRLEQEVDKERLCYRENHLHAVRFCSMQPMRAVPAKVIIFLGMHEGGYPRMQNDQSLNLLVGNPLADYAPKQTDFDRYLFLEALLSARRYLILTYVGYSVENMKTRPPSILVAELLEYLDKGYTLESNKPSERCLVAHPFSPYDKVLFDGSTPFGSYSRKAFLWAQAYYALQKAPKTGFIHEFQIRPPAPEAADETIEIRHLVKLAKNPVEFYFNHVLGIYLERDEDRRIKTEEDFVISNLDKGMLAKRGIRGSADKILKAAELQGKLPQGPFCGYSLDKAAGQIDNIANNLKILDVKAAEVFSIELSEDYEVPAMQDNGDWLLPPLAVAHQGRKVLLAGKLEEVCSEGLIGYYGKDDIYKAWPEYLVFLAVVERFALPIKKTLIMAKDGKTESDYVIDAEEELSNYLDYFQMAKSAVSPLIPEWLPIICEGDLEKLKSVAKSNLLDGSERFYNDYLKWTALDGSLPDMESIMRNWRPVARKAFGKIKPKKGKSEGE